jgi:hypothetical protein
MASAASVKRSSTERCTASTLAAARRNLARVNRRGIAQSLFRHVDGHASAEKILTAILMP